MRIGRGWRAVLAVSLAAAVVTACGRRQTGEINPIQPSAAFNRAKVPLGSAVEVTYTWTLEPGAKKLDQDYRAMVHFLDSHKQRLFEDDHQPQPAPSAWQAGQTYTYTRTLFVPIYPYVGPVEVRMGLYPASGRGERVALKGEDVGLREIKVASIEFLPQTDNIFIVEKEGWHSPEPAPHNPGLERTWIKKEAVASFKNPRKDAILYLEADTNFKAFAQPPVLTLSVTGAAAASGTGAAKPPVGVVVPIENSEIFLKKVRFSAADLGDSEWLDLKLSMSESFVPKQKGFNNDERELSLMVYHLHVAAADQLGQVAGVVDAAPLAPGTR